MPPPTSQGPTDEGSSQPAPKTPTPTSQGPTDEGSSQPAPKTAQPKSNANWYASERMQRFVRELMHAKESAERRRINLSRITAIMSVIASGAVLSSLLILKLGSSP